MLPHELSNGICSLNQGTDRLAMSCIMDITPKGEIKGHRIAETLINADRRMTYTNVQRVNDAIAVYDGTKEELFSRLADKNVKISDLKFKEELSSEILETLDEYRDFAEMFWLCLELSDILRSKRHKRGSIDFDIPECEIHVDEMGKPIEIKPYDRNRATKIIEDFMLAANETVAEDYFWQELPFVYRTHETPDPEKITKLGIFINNFGYTIKMGQEDIHPKELQKLLEKIEGTDEEALISRLTLRSISRLSTPLPVTDISDLRQSITAISLHPSGVILICRYIGS
jgi:ribonuclease R